MKFAEGILEGACWNVQKSCKRLTKLGNIDEVRLFYARTDNKINRKTICKDKRFRKYYWNMWTMLCLKNKHIAMALLACLIPLCKLIKK